MEHVVDTLHRLSRNGEVGKIPLDKIDAIDVRQIVAMAGDETVDDAHALAASDELFRKVGTDETSAAGDEVKGHEKNRSRS
jgi:hypothetical protein